jgi:hypothetical protein
MDNAGSDMDRYAEKMTSEYVLTDSIDSISSYV